MLITFHDRPSDSPFIERVWRSHSDRSGTFHSIAEARWEMVVTRLEGETFLTVRGPETRGTAAECPANGEWLGIRFKLGTFMPLLPPGRLRDRNDVTLPDARRNAFWLHGSAREYPSFENVEAFVSRLVRDGLLVTDRTVLDAIQGRAGERCVRTEQRRVLRATGMTIGAMRQIERARYATRLLVEGGSILDVTHRAGYCDQAHLTRSLRRFVGLTPARIRRGEQQLSFLYNTGPQ